MARLRLVISIAATSIVVTHAVFAFLAAAPTPAPRPLDTSVPQAVAVSDERATFDLDFSGGRRYLLLVGSLGDSARTFDVAIDSRAVDHISQTPFRPLAPLGPVRPPPVIAEPLAAMATSSPLSQGERGPEKTPRPELPRVTVPLQHREFSLHVTDGPLDDPRQYVTVKARLVAERPTVRVYLDEQQGLDELAPGLADEIAQRLDETVIPVYAARFGTFRDVDGDGTFAVLLTPWLQRLQGGRTSLGGFVRSADFRPNVAAPFGNGCDMLYLNSNLRGGEALQALLAHEFMHAVCYSVRLPDEHGHGGLPPQDDWLNEAMAHLGENLLSTNWSNLDHRVGRFLAAPQEAPLVVEDYYGAGRWRDHGCRGATYLFLRWCVDAFGEDLLGALVQSPTRGVRALERETGVSFADLYRRWNVAMVESTAIGQFSSASSLPAVPLHGRLGEQQLRGVRTTPLDLDESAHHLRLCGTATAYVELTAPHGQVRRIRVQAAPGTRLQLTVIRQTDSGPAAFPQELAQRH